MRFQIDQMDLEKLLSTVSRASEQRSVLPILSNVLLQLEGDRLYAVGSNIELTVQSSTVCQPEQEGAVTLPAKELLSLVSLMDKGKVVKFDLDPSTVTMQIQSGKSKPKLKGIGAEEFPETKSYPNSIEFLIPREKLVEGLGSTLYVVNPNVTNSMQRGLSLVFESGVCRLYAADGFRMAQYTIELPDLELDERIEVIAPLRSLIEVRNIFGREKAEIIRITVDSDENGDNRMLHFDADEISISSQVISGGFAKDLDSFLPEASTTVRVNSGELRTALKILSTFSSDSNNSCDFSFREDSVYMFAQSQERGSDEEEIDAELEGSTYYSIYNVKYLLDALDSFDTETVLLKGRSMGVAVVLTVESEERPELIAAMSPMARNS